MKYNDGEATQIAMDIIFDMDTQVDEEKLPGKEYMESLDFATPFRDGINKQIAQIGYVDDLTDVFKRKAFLIAQYQKYGIKQPSDPTLKSWLTGDKAPTGNNIGRENVFQLCFALEMNAVETAEFFLKAALLRPFNYKKTNEAVYFHCLLTGKTYNDAIRIIQAIGNIPQTVSIDRDMETEQLGLRIAAIQDENELIQYLAEHRYAEDEQHLTATKEIENLLQSCYELAEKETAYTKEKPKAVKSEDALLDVIYDYDAYSMKTDENLTIQDSKLPKFLKANWLDRQSFNNIKMHKKISDDVYRKAIILLTFYKFYATAYIAQRKKHDEAQIDLRQFADQFESQLESSLAHCGYVQLYKRNPFDWVMLYCAAFSNPLNQFREIISEYFLYETYPEDEE